MSTLSAYSICEFSTEVVPSFEFQYIGCTKFLCLWKKFVQVSEFSTKVSLALPPTLHTVEVKPAYTTRTRWNVD